MPPRPLNLLHALTSAAALALGSAAAQSPPEGVDYVAFTLGLPNGLVDVAALDLPEEFVRRVAERSVRKHLRRQLRQVAAAGPAPSPPRAMPPECDSTDSGVRVHAFVLEAAAATAWHRYRPEVPALRGFRAPPPALANAPPPMEPPGGPDAHLYREAATFVARHLARWGLVRTTFNLLHTWDLPWLAGESLDEATLRAVGVPADLLAFFTVDGRPLTRVIAEWLADGAPAAAVDALAGRAAFSWSPSCPGFAVAPEDGSGRAGGLRMQLPVSDFTHGPGDGSVLDVLRQLAGAGGGVPIWASVHAGHVEPLRRRLCSWPVADRNRIALFSCPLPLTQWAQDNGKPGLAPRPADPPRREIVTLLPRYPSRNEQMTKFLPGEAAVFQALENTIGRGVVSPLLFQGGNVMCVVEPRTGARLLLLGEAEVYRNRGLGLSTEQVLEAFRVEFSVDRCAVMPAVSFHLDMELNIRRCGDELVACLPDDEHAARIIVAEAAGALAGAGLISPELAARLTQALPAGDPAGLLGDLRRLVGDLRDAAGRLSGRAAAALVTSPVESPRANAQRLLLAVDVLTAAAPPALVAAPTSDERRYLESLRRRAADRAALGDLLESLGMRVCRIPCLGDAEAGINTVNVVHLPAETLVPVYGGGYRALDEAALAAYREAFGPAVRITPIMTADGQTRYGGLHCMVSLYPRAE